MKRKNASSTFRLIMVDQTCRPLEIKRDYMIYAEKHRLFELFKMILRDLSIYKPDDPVMYLRDELPRLAAFRDLPRLVIIGPPKSETAALVTALQSSTGAIVLTLEDLMDDEDILLRSKLACFGSSEEKWPASVLAAAFSTRLRYEDCLSRGWIIRGFPRNKRQALALQTEAVNPSHVIFLRTEIEKDVGMASKMFQLNPNQSKNERRIVCNLPGLKQCYKHIFKEILIEDDLDVTFQSALAFLSQKWPTGGPVIPRILLLGPRGSGRTSIAKGLVKRFGIVEVSCSYTIKLSAQSYNKDVGLRIFLENKWPIPDYILWDVLQKRLLQPDCKEQGWVLYGYPKTLKQAQLLEDLQLVPNKVIILDIPREECKRRLVDRRFNRYTGSLHDVKKDNDMAKTDTNVKSRMAMLGVHPEYVESEVEDDLLRYFVGHLDDLEKYYSKAIHINVNQPLETVIELVEGAVFFPQPCNFNPQSDDDYSSDFVDLMDDSPESSVFQD